MSMSLVSLLSLLYLIFTFVLIIKKKTMGKTYIAFGAMTYTFVILYSSIPKMPIKFQELSIFIAFSLMIILFGIMIGTIFTILHKSEKASIRIASIFSFLLIITMFNIKGYLTYMYIPILVYMLQSKVNLNFKLK